MRLGYLGPAGTFTEEALRASADTAEAELVPYTTVYDTVMAVQTGDVARALVPIENSLEGGVNQTLDALAGEADAVRIVGEQVLPVRHCLIARTELELGEIELVVSHPHATAQCARFLRARLPRAGVMAATSTAEAVREVAEHDGPWAAIGTRLAATLYGGVVLEDGIEDEPENATRFVWLASAAEPPEESAAPPAGDFKTSLVFWGAGDQSPGWLARCLAELASRDVNLTKIESRPRKKQLGHYLFLVDLEGHVAESRVAEAIAGLRSHCEVVRVLGSYPAA
jgi:prephenate dehydratase